MGLPKKRTKPKRRPEDIIWMLHGPPKVGKSTLASKFDKAIFLATEPGLNFLPVYKVDVHSWDEMLESCASLRDDEHDFRTVVVDTMKIAYNLCSEFVCGEHGIEHPGDLEYGKGYNFVNAEFMRVLNALSGLGMGLVMICHTKLIDVTARGRKVSRAVPDLSDSIRRQVLALADVILYCCARERRKPRTDEDEEPETAVVRLGIAEPRLNVEAGDRSGKLPPEFELSYETIKAAMREGGSRGK